MGLFDKFRAGLKRSHDQLVHELKRIVSRSPKLTDESIEELETVLISADFGAATTERIVAAVRKAYESQGGNGDRLFEVAARELSALLSSASAGLARQASPPTVVSLVGVNGTGKTTTCAKLAWRLRQEGGTVVMAACDTFRAAAIEQLRLWGQRLEVPVIAGAYGADASAVAHDALNAAVSRKADYLLVDTAGRLHTKSNLMQELQKLHRVLGKKMPGAPHETLMVVDATTGMNALTQAREFNKAVALTGLVLTKLDGTSKGGTLAAIHRELEIPVKFVGLGEQPEDLQPFDAGEFARALFAVDEAPG